MAITDPSGILLKRQGMETFLANQEAQRQKDYGPGGSAIDQAVHMTGPMPDPQWQAFFQALQNQGVTKIATGKTPADQVRNADPSTNQFRGESVQPDYFTGGDTFMGRHTTPYVGDDPTYAGRPGLDITPPTTALGQSILALKHRALPTPEGWDAIQRRLYAGHPEDLARSQGWAAETPGT